MQVFTDYQYNEGLLLEQATYGIVPATPIYCIKEVDITTMTSPIGLWTILKPHVWHFASNSLSILPACTLCERRDSC